jgi:hypothetical protein
MNPDSDSDPDPAIFVIDLQDANKKQVFRLILFEGTFTSYFEDKKSKRSHKKVGFQVFLTIGSVIQQAQKHLDPTDPDSDQDPQHCCFPLKNYT